MKPAELAELSTREFRYYLVGLSSRARWPEWARAQGRVVTSEAEAQAVIDRTT